VNIVFRKFDDKRGGGFASRPMIKGDWTCSECGTKITELPFEPAQDRPIYCRECWMNKRRDRFSR